MKTDYCDHCRKQLTERPYWMENGEFWCADCAGELRAAAREEGVGDHAAGGE